MSVALVCMTTDPNITTQQEAFMFLGEGFRAEVGYKVRMPMDPCWGHHLRTGHYYY